MNKEIQKRIEKREHPKEIFEWELRRIYALERIAKALEEHNWHKWGTDPK